MLLEPISADTAHERRRARLARALCAVEGADEMEAFLVDLCTPQELRALSERWHVAQLLERGEDSYREINAKTGVSTTTVGRVARFLREEPHGGYRRVLAKLRGDQGDGDE